MNTLIAQEASKGGKALKKKYGLIHFRKMGKRSALRRKEIKNERLRKKELASMEDAGK